MLASSREPCVAARSRGRVMTLPYEPWQTPGRPGGANPCRGRCSHRPGNLALPQGPAGGISGLRAAAARRLASETRLRAQSIPPLRTNFSFRANRNGCGHPGDRRAGCPHPAAPCGIANIPVLNRRGAAGVNARPTERGKHSGRPGRCNLAQTQTSVGADSISARLA